LRYVGINVKTVLVPQLYPKWTKINAINAGVLIMSSKGGKGSFCPSFFEKILASMYDLSSCSKKIN
jgi:hypothetical protein